MLKLKSLLAVGAAAVVSLTACSSNQTASTTNNKWSGPTVMASVTVADATPGNETAKVIRTQHYEIYSTIQDRPDFVSGMAQLMEGAYGMYRTLAPSVQPTDHPMRCYMFGTRLEWIDFTRLHTGESAPIYLRISRGGYTIHDWYVAYYLGGDNSTYSVAAHEGWHQFVSRHFKGRMPPFLEEGLACMFEDVEWNNGLPRFNLTLNPDRALSLRRVVDANELFPLDQLVTLQAGDIVGRAGIRIEAFYSQSWAFARYLWDGENGKYRPALQHLLADAAAGTIYDPTGYLQFSYRGFNPAGARPLIEHYLGEDLATVEDGYRQFVQKVAYEDLMRQYQMQQ